MTLLSRRPCIHRIFPGSLRRGRSKQPRRRPLLLTAVAPPPWCRGRRSRPRQPLPLPLPSRVGSRRDARVRLLFRLPPAASGVPVANVAGGETVLLTGVLSIASGGLPVSALAGYWGRVLGAVHPAGRVSFPFLYSPPLACFVISFPTYQSVSPRSLVLGQKIEKMLAKDALEIVLDPGPGFYSRLFLWRRRRAVGVP